MSKAAIVIVGGLAIAYTAASWYTGTKTEETLSDNIAIANAYLQEEFAGNKDNVVVQVKTLNYQRGIFSSKADYVIELQTDDEHLSFPYTSEIYHGPWPVKAIAQGQLLPVMSYAHSELKKEGNNLGLFNLSKNPVPLYADSYLHWDSSVSSTAVLNPLSFTDNNQTLSIDTTTFKSHSYGITQGNYSGIIGDVTLLEAGTERELGSLRGTTFEGDYTYNEGMSVGTHLMQSKQLQVSAHPLITVKLQDMSITANADIKNNLQDQSLNYLVKNIELNGQSFGSFDLGLAFNQFDMKQWMEIVNKAPGDSAAIQPHIMALLKNNPTIAISPLRWTIKDAVVESNTTLQLQVPQDENDPQQYIKQLNLDVLLDRNALLYSAGENSMPLFMYDERLAQAEKAGLFSLNGNKAELSLYVANGGQTVKLNGEAITIPELSNRLAAADESLGMLIDAPVELDIGVEESEDTEQPAE